MAVKSKVKTPQQRVSHGRLEDTLWMIECGETNADAIAKRLGYTSGRGVVDLLRRNNMLSALDKVFDPLKHSRMGNRNPVA